MNSPNELSPMRGSDLPVARMSKKPLLLVLLVGCILAAVLIYSVNFMERGRPEEQALPVEVQPESPFSRKTVTGVGHATRAAVVEAPAPVQPEKQIVVLAPPKDEAGENARREQEQLRRLKLQENIDALRSPLVVKKGEQLQPDKAAAVAPVTAEREHGQGTQWVRRRGTLRAAPERLQPRYGQGQGSVFRARQRRCAVAPVGFAYSRPPL